MTSSGVWKKVSGSEFSYTDTPSSNIRDLRKEQVINLPITDIVSATYFRTRISCQINCTYHCDLYDSRYLDFTIDSYNDFSTMHGYSGDLTHRIITVYNTGNDTDQHTISAYVERTSRIFTLSYLTYKNTDMSIMSVTFDLCTTGDTMDHKEFDVSNNTIPVTWNYTRGGNYIDAGSIIIKGYIECSNVSSML